MRKGVCVWLILALTACGGSAVPKGILPPGKMYPAVKDMMMADEFMNNFVMKDSTISLKQRRSELYAKVFALHHTTRKQFYDSYLYYQQHPDLMKEVFDSLATGLKKKEFPKAKDTTKAKEVKVDSALE